MPTYEYKCLECDHRFEAFQSMKDDPLESCPECEGSVKRLISSGAGLIFKGSGFFWFYDYILCFQQILAFRRSKLKRHQKIKIIIVFREISRIFCEIS